MLAFYVHHLSPFLIQFHENIGVRWYGLSYVVAFLLGILVLKHLSRRGLCDIPEAKVADFIIFGAIFGVVLGGRLGYMLFYDFDQFIAHPYIILTVWNGGMSAHGGILGLSLYTLWYSRKHKIPWFNLGDNLVVAAPIGLFLGRIANFINGELYGRATTVAWAMQFPGELRTSPEEADRAIDAAMKINPDWNNADAVIEASRTSEPLRASLSEILIPRHPSQLYEAFLEGAVLFTLMWFLRTKVKMPNGILVVVFFIAYALLRSTSEFFREPDAPLTGALTRGQFLSIFLVVMGLIFIAVIAKHPTYPKAYRKKK